MAAVSLEIADGLDAGASVVGSLRLTGVTFRRLGSVSRELVHDADCTVIFLPSTGVVPATARGS